METLLDASAMVERRQESWCCLLCLRKFANQAHVQKHLAKSALHADNLASATAAGRITMPKEQHSALAMKRPREQALTSSSSSGGDGVGSSGIATSNKLSAIEQMELFEKRLKVEAQRQPEKQIAARPNAEAEVDSTRARTINQQRDWECSGCSMVRDRPPRQPPPLQPSCTAPHPDRALLGHGAFF